MALHGHHVLHAWCPNQHRGEVQLDPTKPLRLASYWTQRLRCSQCGERATEIRYVWDITSPEAVATAQVVDLRRAR